MAVAAAATMMMAAPAVAQSAAPTTGPGWKTQVDAEKRSTPNKSAAKPAESSEVRASAIELIEEPGRTRISLTLSRWTAVKVYTLANPHRVIIDLANVSFDLPQHAGRQGRGLVTAFRYGLIAPGRARIVADIVKPVRVESADMAKSGQGTNRLEVKLAATDEATFQREATAPDNSQPDLVLKTLHEEIPPPATGKARTRPVIVIDPGHGGIDSGTVSSTDIMEKDVVLSVSRRLRSILASSGRYNITMTRSTDVFVALDARVAVSRRLDADLFVSIHADAIDSKVAQNVRGATVYTLSERPSDEQARLLAEKENAADTLAGLSTSSETDRDHVKGILIDLMQRETNNFSSAFSSLLVHRLQRAVELSREPQRGAAFKVLKQTQSPSVLIELGYMSNLEDEKLMRTEAWQKRVAEAIAAAIDAYFAKRSASSP